MIVNFSKLSERMASYFLQFPTSADLILDRTAAVVYIIEDVQLSPDQFMQA